MRPLFYSAILLAFVYETIRLSSEHSKTGIPGGNGGGGGGGVITKIR